MILIAFNFLAELPHCDFGVQMQSCGTCYAYSAVDSLSHRICMRTGRQTKLSVDSVVSKGYTSLGCSGGNPLSVFVYLENNPIEDSRTNKTYHVKRYSSHKVTGSENIKEEIKQNGPLSASLYADNSFWSYKQGIYSTGVKNRVPNHSVEMVGWGDGFWIIRNSFSTTWGENGTMRINMGVDNAGIEEYCYASTPIED